MSEFENIDINISDDEMNMLCRIYVEQHFEPATISLFHEAENREGIKKALYNAVINEMVIKVLKDQIKVQIKEQEKEE